MIEIRAYLTNYDIAIGLVVLERNREGDITHFGQPIAMVPVEGQRIEPCVEFDPKKGAAQTLMDDLWRCGVRPTEYGSSGQIAAIEAHLKTVREIEARTAGEAVALREIVGDTVRALIAPNLAEAAGMQ